MLQCKLDWLCAGDMRCACFGGFTAHDLSRAVQPRSETQLSSSAKASLSGRTAVCTAPRHCTRDVACSLGVVQEVAVSNTRRQGLSARKQPASQPASQAGCLPAQLTLCVPVFFCAQQQMPAPALRSVAATPPGRPQLFRVSRGTCRLPSGRHVAATTRVASAATVSRALAVGEATRTSSDTLDVACRQHLHLRLALPRLPIRRLP